jgi:hypothetical protein
MPLEKVCHIIASGKMQNKQNIDESSLPNCSVLFV